MAMAEKQRQADALICIFTDFCRAVMYLSLTPCFSKVGTNRTNAPNRFNGLLGVGETVETVGP
jgi:hypothetical protein